MKTSCIGLMLCCALYFLSPYALANSIHIGLSKPGAQSVIQEVSQLKNKLIDLDLYSGENDEPSLSLEEVEKIFQALDKNENTLEGFSFNFGPILPHELEDYSFMFGQFSTLNRLVVGLKVNHSYPSVIRVLLSQLPTIQHLELRLTTVDGRSLDPIGLMVHLSESSKNLQGLESLSLVVHSSELDHTQKIEDLDKVSPLLKRLQSAKFDFEPARREIIQRANYLKFIEFLGSHLTQAKALVYRDRFLDSEVTKILLTSQRKNNPYLKSLHLSPSRKELFPSTLDSSVFGSLEDLTIDRGDQFIFQSDLQAAQGISGLKSLKLAGDFVRVETELVNQMLQALPNLESLKIRDSSTFVTRRFFNDTTIQLLSRLSSISLTQKSLNDGWILLLPEVQSLFKAGLKRLEIQPNLIRSNYDRELNGSSMETCSGLFKFINENSSVLLSKDLFAASLLFLVPNSFPKKVIQDDLLKKDHPKINVITAPHPENPKFTVYILKKILSNRNDLNDFKKVVMSILKTDQVREAENFDMNPTDDLKLVTVYGPFLTAEAESVVFEK